MKKLLILILAIILNILNSSNLYAESLGSIKPCSKQYLKSVKKDKSGYKIYADNGKAINLKSVEKDYNLEGCLEDIGYFSFKVTGDEWGGYELLNKNTGEIFNLEDAPFLSPDKKTIICAQASEIGGPYPIQIFVVLPNKLSKIKEIGNNDHDLFKIHSWKNSQVARITSKYNKINYLLIYDKKKKNWILINTTEIFE